MSLIRSLFGVLAVGFLFIAAPADASILTFDMTDVGGSIPLGNTSYGDNITSTGPVGPNNFQYGKGNAFTPDVTVDYSASHSTSSTETGIFYRTGGAPTATTNLAILLTRNLDNAVAANRKFHISFTPDAANVRVRLNSFLLEDWAGFATGSHTVTWTVFHNSVLPSNVLATNTVTWSDGGSVLVNTGLDSWTTDVVILELRHDAGARNDLYIDNINFDQYIPEPASVGMMLMGVAAIAARRSRKPR